MYRFASIGEALIDFVPIKKGFYLKDVAQFERVVGGAPANVACAFSKLGGESILLTKLGTDAFGDHIIEELQKSGVNCRFIPRSKEHDTSLAFVSHTRDGRNDYSFYRRNAADLSLTYEEVKGAIHSFELLHFCSVSLVESEMKQTHLQLIKEAKQKIISFDPNVRLALWDNPLQLKQTILDFIPYANILKIADDELAFMMDTSDIEEALKQLWNYPSLQCVVYTKGAKGASIYTRNHQVHHPGFQVEVQDTTGAGDAFIGAFLWYIALREQPPKDMDEEALEKGLLFANAYAALSTKKAGAINAYVDVDELAIFLEEYTD